MQGIFLLSIYVMLAVIGFMRPFVFGLGYVWVDLFTPQDVYPEIMGLFPVSLVMACGTVLSYLLFDRKSPPKLNSTMLLLLAFGGWMTMTLMWAEVPDYAWTKWNWAVKTVLFAPFLPFLFRSRIQIEAFVLTVLISITGILSPVGVKAVLGGGGYGWSLVPLASSGAGLSEGSTLAMYAVATIPLLIFISRYSLILPWIRARLVGSFGLIMCHIAAALGTFARTGLVALLTLAGLFLLGSKRKTSAAALTIIVALCMLPLMTSEWIERMQTIQSNEETSEEGRIYVWRWTLEYVLEHPFGGGLEAYRINEPAMRAMSGGRITLAKAFHSIYFEILGETGIVGLMLWGGTIVIFFRNMMRLYRTSKREPELSWISYLSKMTCFAMIIYLVGGAFIGVAFQPFLYYLIVLGVCLSEYHRRWLENNRTHPSRPRAGSQNFRNRKPHAADRLVPV